MKDKNDHPWVGVDNIILNEKEQILLIQRSSKSKSYPSCWGLIGGWMRWGETVKEALKREAMEEVGVTIEVVKFAGRYYDDINRHPTKNSIALPHICKIITGRPTVNQPEEVQDVKWFSPGGILELDMAYDHKQMLLDVGLIKEV